ncbi:hypothetical protein [Helicobacter bilis]|uniref:Uncharacterized protein n=1 Tax=Helicobacter bilis TaxID=37372 RepID=A0A4U8U8G0_9HELI|nr:hypothetical protein [Helicobacter bilis]MCI7411117.1 hypothetical protein [Helicobacter bilis]MDD7296842.1 hypothetical protein [Helicobacter bilis]MDY4400837.1 hypothetical protein [Helicobacter bilis]TLE07212.1 hypothetical protein LS78_010510 [Helicobacter bilis]TLE08117.1 hypothetical protein LS79_010560 [Helicobacter bilis]
MKQNFKQIVAQGYKAFITTEAMATKNNKLECLEVVGNMHENADLLGKVKDVLPISQHDKGKVKHDKAIMTTIKKA